MKPSDTKHTTINVDDCWNRIGVFSKSGRQCTLLGKVGHCRNCPTYAKMGRKLLNRPFPENYRAEVTHQYEQEKPMPDRRNLSAFVFRAGDEWLAITSRLIFEVVPMGPIHSIPHKSSRIFRGIVNVRGKLELCVSIGGVLRIEKSVQNIEIVNPERLILAIKEEQSVVFPVSEVYGHHHYVESQLKPLPVTVSGSKAVYTKGILHIDEKQIDVGLLDDQLLFRILTRNLA